MPCAQLRYAANARQGRARTCRGDAYLAWEDCDAEDRPRDTTGCPCDVSQPMGPEMLPNTYTNGTRSNTTDPCPNLQYQWIAGDWTECSSSACGTSEDAGTQTRVLTCVEFVKCALPVFAPRAVHALPAAALPSAVLDVLSLPESTKSRGQSRALVARRCCPRAAQEHTAFLSTLQRRCAGTALTPASSRRPKMKRAAVPRTRSRPRRTRAARAACRTQKCT